MKSQKRKFRGFAVALAWAAALGFVSLGSMPASAKGKKVDICHFRSAKGGWTLKSKGPRAARKHMEHHDDALPGGTTSQTGTKLDANCVEVEVEVEPSCPCEGLTLAGLAWDDSFPTEDCVDADDIGIFSLSTDFESFQFIFVDEVFRQCIFWNDSPSDVLDISEAEVAACEDSLRQIAANDGVACD